MNVRRILSFLYAKTRRSLVLRDDRNARSMTSNVCLSSRRRRDLMNMQYNHFQRGMKVSIKISLHSIRRPAITNHCIKKSQGWVHCIYQIKLFLSSPTFYFFFPGNGVIDIFKNLIINKVVAIIFSRKCFFLSAVEPMLYDPPPEIIGNTSI